MPDKLTTDPLVKRLRALEAYCSIPGLPFREAADEIERLRAGLRLIATDEHRLMGVTARQTAESILGGKCVS